MASLNDLGICFAYLLVKSYSDPGSTFRSTFSTPRQLKPGVKSVRVPITTCTCTWQPWQDATTSAALQICHIESRQLDRCHLGAKRGRCAATLHVDMVHWTMSLRDQRMLRLLQAFEPSAYSLFSTQTDLQHLQYHPACVSACFKS